jgi:hypothetical protein
MMLLRGPQSLTRHPSLGDPAAEMSLLVVAAALGRRASQAIAEYQRFGRDEFLDTWARPGNPIPVACRAPVAVLCGSLADGDDGSGHRSNQMS